MNKIWNDSLIRQCSEWWVNSRVHIDLSFCREFKTAEAVQEKNHVENAQNLVHTNIVHPKWKKKSRKTMCDGSDIGTQGTIKLSKKKMDGIT